MNRQPLLTVEGLTVNFRNEAGAAHGVNGIDLQMRSGEIVGLVGESGSGKTVTALAIMRLLPAATGLVSGRVELQGQDLGALAERELRSIRGRRVSMIFQDPVAALNPVFTIGKQLTRVAMRHRGLRKSEARNAAIEMLRKVGIAAPERRVDEFPHQLSGGTCQRIMIAMALCCEPDLLIADEPTTALDVTTQAQVLELLLELQKESGMAILLITHDLGIVAETCDRVVVMRNGIVVEDAAVNEFFESPTHSYSKSLLEAIPRLPVYESVKGPS